MRSLTAKLHPKLARFGALNLPATIEPGQLEAALRKKAKVQEEIGQLQQALEQRKAERAKPPQPVPLGELPAGEQFDLLSSASKDLVDTIKLIAYRAETAMGHLAREALPKWRGEEARRLLQSLYTSEADWQPDPKAGTLTVRLHYPANPMLGRAVEKLCEELTATETVFPTTTLRLVYKLVPSQNPRDQEV